MPGSIDDNDDTTANLENGFGRLHKLFQYTFAAQDPSGKVRN